MKKYFVSFSVIRPRRFSIVRPKYFQFMNEEIEVEDCITSLKDVYRIEEELRESLIEIGIIPKKHAYMYTITILNWKPFDGSKITAGT